MICVVCSKETEVEIVDVVFDDGEFIVETPMCAQCIYKLNVELDEA